MDKILPTVAAVALMYAVPSQAATIGIDQVYQTPAGERQTAGVAMPGDGSLYALDDQVARQFDPMNLIGPVGQIPNGSSTGGRDATGIGNLLYVLDGTNSVEPLRLTDGATAGIRSIDDGPITNPIALGSFSLGATNYLVGFDNNGFDVYELSSDGLSLTYDASKSGSFASPILGDLRGGDAWAAPGATSMNQVAIFGVNDSEIIDIYDGNGSKFAQLGTDGIGDIEDLTYDGLHFYGNTDGRRGHSEVFRTNEVQFIVPEPTSLAGGLAGLIALAMRRRR